MPLLKYSACYAVVITTFYYLFQWRTIPFGQWFEKYIIKILITLLLVIFVTYALSEFYITFDISYTRGYLLQFGLLVCLVYVLPFLCEGDSNNAFNRISELVIVTLCIQVCISISAFLNDTIASWLLSVSNMRDLLNSPNIPVFRFYNLGGVLFLLPATYGMCLILYVRLVFSNYRTKLFSGISMYVIFVLLLIGIILTGRTGFVGLIAALILLLFLKTSFRSKLSFLLKTMGLLLLLIVMFSRMLPGKQIAMIQKDVIPFAFEFFINYMEDDKLATTSSDALKGMYYELPVEVFLGGTGHYRSSDGGYYGNTDSGYMRPILYGGIFYFLLLVYYQLFYFREPLKKAWRARDEIGRNDVLFWLTALIYMFVLNYKGETIGYFLTYECILLLLGYAYINTNELSKAD
jgi:hypothetical protein